MLTVKAAMVALRGRSASLQASSRVTGRGGVSLTTRTRVRRTGVDVVILAGHRRSFAPESETRIDRAAKCQAAANKNRGSKRQIARARKARAPKKNVPEKSQKQPEYYFTVVSSRRERSVKSNQCTRVTRLPSARS